jgi:hypothetical protein
VSEVKSYQKQPVIIQAVKFEKIPTIQEGTKIFSFRDEWAALEKFTNHLVRIVDGREDDADIYYYVFDRLHNTWVEFYPGDYIIKGTEGEFYPHNGELFEKNYKQVGVRGSNGVVGLESIDGSGRP